jgi:hypothetical protein
MATRKDTVEAYTEEQEVLILAYRLINESKNDSIFGKKAYKKRKNQLLSRIGAILHEYPWENPYPGVWFRPAVAPDHQPAHVESKEN